MLLSIGITILKVTLVVVLIGVMILALTAINYSMLLRRHRSDGDDAARLRREVKDSDSVITSDSVFHAFLARDIRRHRKTRHAPAAPASKHPK